MELLINIDAISGQKNGNQGISFDISRYAHVTHPLSSYSNAGKPPCIYFIKSTRPKFRCQSPGLC